jgi:hypothetical protein
VRSVEGAGSLGSLGLFGSFGLLGGCRDSISISMPEFVKAGSV